MSVIRPPPNLGTGDCAPEKDGSAGDGDDGDAYQSALI
jgi:hypothetical protein